VAVMDSSKVGGLELLRPANKPLLILQYFTKVQ
jgi:hypothetical protein